MRGARSRLVDLHDARLVCAPRAASVLFGSAGRRVGLEVEGDGLRVGAVPVRAGVGSCDGVVGRGLDEVRCFRIEGRLQEAAGSLSVCAEIFSPALSMYSLMYISDF